MRLPVILAASLAFLAPFSTFAQKKDEKKKPSETTPANSAMVIGGTELKPGKKTVVTMEMDATIAPFFSKLKGSYSKLKIGVALPADFKPASSCPILVVCSTDSGNATPLSCLDPLVSEGIKAGYVVVAGEPDSRPSETMATEVYYQCFLAARSVLVSEFSGLSTSSHVLAGHSGGGKRAPFFAGLMASDSLRVGGVFMSGVNFDTFSVTKGSSKLRKVPIYVSNGAKDSYVPADRNKAVLDSLKSGGFRNVKAPGHPGGHVIVQEHLKEALAWFKSEAL